MQDRPVEGGVYREAVVGQPLSLNPLEGATDPLSNDLTRLVHAGLVQVIDVAGPEPDLAANWQITSDGRTYTFHLKTGLLWHDRQPLTTADVAATVAFVQSPSFKGPSELAAMWRRVHVETPDSLTVRFTLDEPYAPFLEACSLPVLPPSMLAAGVGERAARGGPLPVGAGPFRVVEINEQGIRLARHDGYSGIKPYLDEVQFRFFPDNGQALLALRNGQVDGALAPNEAVARAAGTPDTLVVNSVPTLGHQVILYLNLRNRVLAEGRVRQAVALSLDRGALIAAAMSGRAAPAFGPVAHYSWAYTSEVEVAPDPAQAQQLLDSEGWTGGPTRAQAGQPLRLELAVPGDDRMVALGQAIQAQLQGVGIQVEVHPINTLDLYRERLIPRAYDMALAGIWLGAVDPDPYPLWHSSQATDGFNFASYRSERADELLLQERLSLGQEQRRLALVAFQKVWKDDAPSVVLASPIMTYAISAQIRGVRLGEVPDTSARFQHVVDWYVQTERKPAFLP
jgi:peptide/nickel transport system substrate-binding protein